MALIPTLTLFDSEARKSKSYDDERQGWIDRLTNELRVFSHSGGEVLFGTDVGYTDHFDTQLEFTLMSSAGMDFQQILASLTTVPARRFGYAGRSGRVARGLDADLTVLQRDPSKDITAFSRVQFTISRGRVIYSAATAELATVGGPDKRKYVPRFADPGESAYRFSFRRNR